MSTATRAIPVPRVALVVDDHPAIRLAVADVLREQFHCPRVLEAEDALSAMAVSRDEYPELALVDLDLPGLPGVDLIERLLGHYPRLRVVALSALDVSVWPARVMRAGGHAFVAKHCGLAELSEALRMVLAGYLVYPVQVMADARRLTHAAGGVLAMLSGRELTVLQYLARGLSNKAIAEVLRISGKTVSTHKVNIMSKLKLESMVELVDFARRHRVVE